MANLIVMTSSLDGRFIDIDYGNLPSRWKNVRVRVLSVRTIGIIKDSSNVEIIFDDGSIVSLSYQYIDNINGVLPISNDQFCEILKLLM